jgi:hypothetical protein
MLVAWPFILNVSRLSMEHVFVGNAERRPRINPYVPKVGFLATRAERQSRGIARHKDETRKRVRVGDTVEQT